MLYVCIPVHNEATTIGVLLWRIRTVLQEYTREYEVVVYDDGSTDATAEVLEPYRRVLPLTVLRAPQRRGVAFAVDALCRHVIAHTRYPRRDAVVLMQGDFTDRPEDLPELAKRFEGGADLVIGRRPASEDQPQHERRLRRLAPWVLRPFVRVAEVEDLLTAFRLVRVSVLRDLARARGDALLAEGEGWAATVDFALAVAPYARRVDVVELPGRYDLRPRASRLDWWRELRGLAGYAWRSRGRRVAAGERLGGERGAERPERAAERAVERPAERAPDRADVAVIGSVSALAGAAERAGAERPGRPSRERARPDRGARGAERAERGERVERGARPERPTRSSESVEPEAPRKRGRARRAETAADASVSADAPVPSDAATEPTAATPAARPPRPERPARQRTPRERAPEATGAAEPMADVAPSVDAVAAGAAPSADAPPTAMPDGVAEAPGDGEGGEPVVRKKARRRRRRSRGSGAGNGEPGTNGGDDANGDTSDASDAWDGDARDDADRAAPRPDSAGRSGDDPDRDGEGTGDADDGAPSDGPPGEGAPRKRTRRRRRGRGRGERPDAGAEEGGSGTDAPGGVGERAPDPGVAAPRASEPDPTAD